MSMSPRDRWLAILERRTPDRIPTDFWSTPEVLARLKRELECGDDETLWRKLHIDRPRLVEPRCKRQLAPNTDIWGIRYRRVNYGAGAYDEAVHHPLAGADSVDQIHAHRWPTPEDFDYSTILQGLEHDNGFRMIQGAVFEPFLIYCDLRGREQSFEDLALNPPIADAILDHLFEFHWEHNRRIFSAGRGKIDFTYVAEDLGSQNGPLISLEHYRRFLRPNQQKMAELARSFGVHVFYHTDGAARMFIPDLIDVVGIEVLNPIQWRCSGMDRESLVRDFGRHIAFHGAIDNQQTLPFGSPADIVAEVRQCRDIFHNHRWICAPCHNIQPVTPTANILALYRAIRELAP